MQELWLDGSKLQLSPPPSWGELLEKLEEEHLAAGRTIWTIAFDGEEQEDFRSEDQSRRATDELSRVDVVSIHIEDLSRQLVSSAPGHFQQVSDVLGQAVTLYRQKLPQEGASQLHAALAGFDMLIKLVSSVGVIWHEELSSLDGAEAIKEESLGSLRDSLESLVAVQESGDGDEIARVVEQDLIPRITPWASLFEQLDRAIQAADAPASGSPA